MSGGNEAMQVSLFNEPVTQAVESVPMCHDCGKHLTDMERLLPKTCERDLACLGCCTTCHHAFLSEVFSSKERCIEMFINNPNYPKPKGRHRVGMSFR